ncbi:hypothetical protein [Methanosarcina sp.]|uniref:hypothetical protein n=1 Tax=Methanosarcina sp. TaxID=2213 RepID=UPI002ABCA415|nr:hypothetical protein [Methanosarcina sp.]MDY9925310.1 hypothetical protein [Methanosarcina sp.]
MNRKTQIMLIISITAGTIIIAILYTTIQRYISKYIVATFISSITTTIAIGSLILTKNTLEETQKSVILTRETLIKTENEQKRREIEKSLDYFYYPLRDFLSEWMAPANNPDFHKENITNFEMDHISQYRYLATDKSRNYFEKVYTPHSYIKYQEAAQLLEYIIEDINKKNDMLKDIKTKH